MLTLEKSPAKIKTTSHTWICILLSIVISSCLIWASTVDKKWLAATLLGIVGIFCCFILHKYLRALLLVLAVFLIPLRIDFYLFYKKTYFLPSAYPGLPVTSFDVIFFIIFCYWIVQIIRGIESIRFFPSISIPFILYILFTSISAFQLSEFGLGFSTVILILKSYLVFLYFANTIQKKNDILIVLIGLVAGVWLQIFVGGIQYAGIGSLDGVFGVPEGSSRMQLQGEHILSRVGGTYGHPNSLAKYLGFSLCALLGYSLATSRGWLPKLSLATVAFGGLILLFTLSRGTWVALAVSFSFIFYQAFIRRFNSRFKSVAMVAMVAVFLAGSTIAIFEDVRIRLFEEDYRSAQSRIPMAIVALNIIFDHPITGIGVNNYTSVMQGYDRTQEWQTFHFPHPVHNSYLLIAAESGIPALLAFLWILFSAFAKVKLAIQRPSALTFFQIGWAAALISWVIAALFDRDFAGCSIMLWLTVGMLTAIHRTMTEDAEEDVKRDTC